eukprot:Plantae.Rhodophyta-Purpureofilum_apyrenoidigerum.ctg5584.p1 GENE.Plantae.Rhodophyta-Purpureofilum_apyrenoidigerum.ctg5584~~Plantae.Rhodophyta-Purpureofilum_apyrenoidigerum.ctg5584.p1  ORF type:complete len:635 (+),score=162.89 Plantae.Rhodophyta-Purpureofilum_apyrenoidigerum.ctg5584:157-1905(+)
MAFVGSGLGVRGWSDSRKARLEMRPKQARRVLVAPVCMAAKKVTYGDEARFKLMAGIEAVANAVKITLGPKGRNVVLQRSYGAPQVVNDGVTIAKDITLLDNEMNTGARLIQEVAAKTDIKAGDGTTTSTVLCQAMVKEGMRGVSAGRNPVMMRRGMEMAAKSVGAEVRRLSRKINGIDDLRAVATISAGNDERIGDIIATSFERSGANGSTVVEESQSLEDEIEFTEGMELDRGFLSPYFVNDQERQVVELKRARVLITDMKMNNIQEIIPILEAIVKSKEPLLIVADDVTGEALSTLVVNKMRGVLDCVAIKAPGFGERRKSYLQDIAILTGAAYIAEDLGLTLDSLTLDQLGTAERIVVGKESTTIISTGDHQDTVEERVAAIKAELSTTSSNFDREKLEERLARLSGGIARIKVGAATETELKDKKLRYEDALNSTKAAVELGVVPGGGTTLLHASKVLSKLHDDLTDEDEQYGVLIVERALRAPIKQIAENAGIEGEVVLYKVLEMDFGMGYNARTGKYVDLVDAGVIDPTKVVCWGLDNAVSIASLVLTTECLVSEIPEPKGANDGMNDLAGQQYM